MHASNDGTPRPQSVYRQAFDRAALDPDGFWLEQAARIRWFQTPSSGFSEAPDGGQQWFADGLLNTAWLTLDAQLEAGRGDQVALVYDSPVTSTTRRLTYAQLTEQVARTAGALAELGVGYGDRVV
ncbi:MAG: acetyl-coenzyme A synthetase N-terminal domain-containing protein, partial [Wenzhouxiangella sp.]|nr:acetyl-coenzyme A synthetase N-terminal domain-containing protein [Wenzhouxiangella sp.]